MTTKKKQLSEITLTKKALKNMYVQLSCWKKDLTGTYLVPDKKRQRILTTPAILAKAHAKIKPVTVYYITKHGKKYLLNDPSPVHEYIAFLLLINEPGCYPISDNTLDGVSI